MRKDIGSTELKKSRMVPQNLRFSSQQNYSGPSGLVGVQGAPQTLKFNMGSGNNFIVKNSNIVIT